MYHPPHIVFACGGSLGNLYPGLSIAKRLKSFLPDAQTTFVGDGGAIERQTARGAGHGYVAIPCKPRPKRAVESLRFVTDNTLGLIAARWFLSENRASLAVGLGGHATAPLLRAAMACGLPTVLLEQNAMPSRTSRWLASRANRVCLGFGEAQPRLPLSAQTLVTGTPGRPSFKAMSNSSLKYSDAGRETRRRLVVIGGAGGARSLNTCVPSALAKLGGGLSEWSVVHQSGEGQLVETERRYRRLGVDAVVVSFIDELADLLRDTDLVICRAGGCTLAELALAGVPAVVVPDSRDGYVRQFENARVVQSLGACRVLDERHGDLTDSLIGTIGPLLTDETARRRHADAIASLARPEAAGQIAEACCQALGALSAVNRPVAAAA